MKLLRVKIEHPNILVYVPNEVCEKLQALGVFVYRGSTYLTQPHSTAVTYVVPLKSRRGITNLLYVNLKGNYA